MMANDVLSTEVEKLKENLRQTRKAILGRGGTISATAGLDAVPKAIFDIPATSSIAFYTDDTIKYKKPVPSGVEDYVELMSLGGGVTVRDVVDGKEVLKKSAVRSIVTERVYERIINYCEVASSGGWEYDGNALYFGGGDTDANCFNLINAPEGVSATIELYYQDDFVGTYGLGEELPTLYYGYNGHITFTGVAVGTVLYPMLFNNALPSEYTSTYRPYYQSVTMSEPVDTIELPATLVNDAHWGYGIVAGGEYYGNTYNFTNKKYTEYITETLEISERTLNGTDVTLGTYNETGNYIAVTMKYATSMWSSKKDAIICTRFKTITGSTEAAPMSVYISSYKKGLRFYMPEGIKSRSDCETWFKDNPVYLQCVNQKATEGTLDIDAPTPFFIKTAGGDTIIFDNEAKADVPSSIKYVRKV